MIDTAYDGGHASPPLTRLGLSHWLRDALAAEMALEAEASGRPQVPVHVGLPLNDGEARSSGRPQVPVRVGLPLNDSEALASDTPALLVSVGQSGYPLTPLNGLQPVTDPHTGIAPAGLFAVARTMAATVTVLAESAEEAMGLADAAEARLLALSLRLAAKEGENWQPKAAVPGDHQALGARRRHLVARHPWPAVPRSVAKGVTRSVR